MNIEDVTTKAIAISAQREIIANQRVTIEYWRGQVAARDERIAELEAVVRLCRDVIATLPIDALGHGTMAVTLKSGESGVQLYPVRDEFIDTLTRTLEAQKGGGDETV